MIEAFNLSVRARMWMDRVSSLAHCLESWTDALESVKNLTSIVMDGHPTPYRHRRLGYHARARALARRDSPVSCSVSNLNPPWVRPLRDWTWKADGFSLPPFRRTRTPSCPDVCSRRRHRRRRRPCRFSSTEQTTVEYVVLVPMARLNFFRGQRLRARGRRG